MSLAVIDSYQSSDIEELKRHLIRAYGLSAIKHAVRIYMDSWMDVDASESECLKVLLASKNQMLQDLVQSGVSSFEELQKIIELCSCMIQEQEWGQSKCVYIFENQLILNLVRTDINARIPCNVFRTLQKTTTYLDFHKCCDITEDLNADGVLVTMLPPVDNTSEWSALLRFYHNGKKMRLRWITFGKDNEDFCMKDLFIQEYSSKTRISVNSKAIVVTQLLLYLCTSHPDICISRKSKMLYKKIQKHRKESGTITRTEKKISTFMVQQSKKPCPKHYNQMIRQAPPDYQQSVFVEVSTELPLLKLHVGKRICKDNIEGQLRHWSYKRAEDRIYLSWK